MLSDFASCGAALLGTMATAHCLLDELGCSRASSWSTSKKCFAEVVVTTRTSANAPNAFTRSYALMEATLPVNPSKTRGVRDGAPGVSLSTVGADAMVQILTVFPRVIPRLKSKRVV